MTENKQSCPVQAGNLEITVVEDGYVVYQIDHDRIHHLNPTAAILLDLCNGKNAEAELPELLRLAFDLPRSPVEQITEGLRTLRQEGLIQ